MLKKLKKLFSGGKAKIEAKVLPVITIDKLGQPVTEDLIVSICVILVYLASSDDQVVQEEAESICQLLVYNLELPEEQIPALIEKAIIMRREKGKIDDFVASLNNSFTIEQRLRILAMAWKLVLSDTKVEKSEERIIVKLAMMLYLSIDHQERARNLAEEGAV